jgi:tetratricopeptide (TPR) repeat protein
MTPGNPPEPARTALEQWLRYAPGPAPLDPKYKYHTFLSYRSVRRHWVLQLYDTLRHLGYSVFLDQMVIPAGGVLASNLNEGLAASASAVLIWSVEYMDSAWCKREYEVMETRLSNGKGYYVIAKLDKAEMPEFASTTVYLDFSDQPEGPTGTGLLKILYGLKGEPLPDAAVRMAAEVDAETNDSLVKVRAARDVGNVDRLIQLSKSDSLAWLSSPVLRCEVADALIALNKNDEAISVLTGVENAFPKAVRPKQLHGLALARNKNWQDAQTIFSELHQAGEIDPETLGMYARTWRDRYAVSQERRHLERARELYLQAFRAVPGNSYVGINAATTSVLLGDADLAKSLAEEVEKLLSGRPPKDYWEAATLAEVQLLKQDYAKAAELYQAAINKAPEEYGSHRTTYDQVLRLLQHLTPTGEQRQALLAPFAHLSK